MRYLYWSLIYNIDTSEKYFSDSQDSKWDRRFIEDVMAFFIIY
jgi:hypothetical protein